MTLKLSEKWGITYKHKYVTEVLGLVYIQLYSESQSEIMKILFKMIWQYGLLKYIHEQIKKWNYILIKLYVYTLRLYYYNTECKQAR